MTEQLIPQPIFESALSKTEIILGDSFRLNTVSENTGDYADIHIVSIAFPDLIEIDDVVKIATYDFTLSPSTFLLAKKLVQTIVGVLKLLLHNILLLKL